MLPTVMAVLKRHLQSTTSPLFRFDARLVRDGCVFAALMLAQSDLESDSSTDPAYSLANLEEGVSICFRVLGEMRWIFSGSAKAREIIMAAWDARQIRDRERLVAQGHIATHIPPSQGLHSGHWSPSYGSHVYPQPGNMLSMHGQTANPGQDYPSSSIPVNPADSYYTYQPEDWLKYEDDN